LDMSSNTALGYLQCRTNQLTSSGCEQQYSFNPFELRFK